MNALPVLADLLRSPQSLLDRDSAELRPILLATIAGGAATFGAVVGAYRGGIQIPFAAIKMPVLFVLPVLLGLPALRALSAVDRQAASWARLNTAALVGMARAALLAAAFSPVLWLYYSVNPDYHRAVLVLAGALALCALPGLATVASALPGRRGWQGGLAALMLLGVLTAQTGWLLRPFIARPTAEVAFLRPLEADVFSGLGATYGTARGADEKWEAERGGMFRQKREFLPTDVDGIRDDATRQETQ